MLEQDTMVQDRYRIVKALGGGGMGQVYLAHDTRLADKPCALKELIPDPHATSEEAKQTAAQFHREAATLAHLSHPNIPDVSDYFEENERFYLVMDYVAGETLTDQLSRSPKGLPQGNVLEWALQLCDVLDYLHTQTPPVIFRDMKPANVMITSEEDIKLIDFGVVRLFNPVKKTDTLKMGTAGYAPPEQYAGQGQTTPRSDIYAMGAMLHELLTGADPTVQPFVFSPPQNLTPSVSSSLSNIVMRAVSLDPEERFSSALAMKKALQEVTQPRRFRLPSINLKRSTGTKVMPRKANDSSILHSRPIQITRNVTRWLVRLGLNLLIAAIVTFIVLSLTGALLLSSVAKQAIGEADWQLETSPPGPFVMTETNLANGMEAILGPYMLDALSHTEANFRPPDTAVLSLEMFSHPISLQCRVEEHEGTLFITLERLNDVHLYVVGGIVSKGINQGFEKAWEDSPLHITSIVVGSKQLTLNLERK